jgi:hypothetical protein
MVSPQFHIKVDESFETIRGVCESTHGSWREKCGFTNDKTSKTKTKVKATRIKSTISSSGRSKDLLQENLEHKLDDLQIQEEEYATLPVDFGELPVPAHEGVLEPVINEEGIRDPTNEINIKNVRRSKRNWKPTQKILESIQQEDGFKVPVNLQACVYDDEYETFLDNANPMCLLAKTDHDTMYWDQAMKQHDAEQFIKAAIDEVSTHQANGHWEVLPKEEVPNGEKVLDAIWSMKRKRRLLKLAWWATGVWS